MAAAMESMAKTAPGESSVTASRDPSRSFQDMILTLHDFWSAQGCVILQPYDMRMGAGTFHTATTLRALGPEPWNAAFVQPAARPTGAMAKIPTGFSITTSIR